MAGNSVIGRVRLPYCFVSGFDGYLATPAVGETWLAAEGSVAAPADKIKDGRLALDDTAAGLPDSLQMQLVLVRFTKAGVLLEARAVRPDGSVTFWSDLVPLDAQGRGRLPFWSHVLEIQRTDKALTAHLSGTGDGRGWMDLPGPNS